LPTFSGLSAKVGGVEMAISGLDDSNGLTAPRSRKP